MTITNQPRWSLGRGNQAVPSRWQATTQPELALRRLLHASGLRCRVHVRPVAGLRRTADIVFRPSKVAVFVDGCFWHGCSQCYGHREYKTNEWYWSPKVERNRRRDRDTDEQLAAHGWAVIRVWEHEAAGAAANDIARVVAARRPKAARWRARSGTGQPLR